MSQQMYAPQFAASCGPQFGSCQQDQKYRTACRLRQELFKSCRRTIAPVEKCFGPGLHIRKLRFGPSSRYRIHEPFESHMNILIEKIILTTNLKESAFSRMLVSRRFISPLYTSRTVPNAFIAVQGENCANRPFKDNPDCTGHSQQNCFSRSVIAPRATSQACGRSRFSSRVTKRYAPNR
ncbi:unnamed protein product [Anisakis simplex]|uniref:Cytochrome c oxidase assembly protein COX19 n=1 Tax=Anisakis simplex TaxID=6269 RepID=A0A0M3J9U5_ANISI|nr:unnamed protein product [Anisakis simplex]